MDDSILFNALNLFKRCFDKIIESAKELEKVFQMQNYLTLVALICLNLASKYAERVSFKVSELLQIVGVSVDPAHTTPERMRKYEFDVLGYLGFKLGGNLSI